MFGGIDNLHPSGSRVRDSLPRNRVAREHAQCEVVTQIMAVEDHAKLTQRIRGQARTFPKSSAGDLAIYEDEAVLTYSGVMTSAGIVPDASAKHASIRGFTSLSGAPQDLEWCFVGISRGTIDVTDKAKRDALAMLQVSGMAAVRHNGNKPIMPGDFVELIVPPNHPGGFLPSDCNSSSRIRPMFNPFKIQTVDFIAPVKLGADAYKRVFREAKDDFSIGKLFEFHNYAAEMGYKPFDHSTANPAAYEKKLGEDVEALRMLVESETLTPDAQIGTGDPIADGWAAFIVLFGNHSKELFTVGGEARDRLLRVVHLFNAMVEGATTLAGMNINRVRKRLAGRSLNYVPVGGELNLLINSRF
jgi:hypothetical protein